jgi:DNA-binding NarL/FixJ family response regulator
MPQSTETTTAKVLLVEDHPMFRERLAMLINKDLEMTVCGETDNIQTALELAKQTKPDIAIVDITLRGSSGIELIKDLKAQGVKTPVLVLSMHDENLYAERVLRAGAKGYITKDEASAKVIAAIKQVLAGGIYVSENVKATILHRIATVGAPVHASGIDLLTDRELEVFQLVGQGRNSREIAERLHLGETTVDTYRARIKDKLHIRNAAELYSRAAQWVQEQN